MKQNVNLPSPVQRVHYSAFQKNGVEVWMKRDDLIHPFISGNKWRKLKYNVLHVQQNDMAGLLTFGGAFSNHLAATAFAGKYFGLKTVGIVRGTDADINNPTLKFAKECGMQFKFVSREAYKLRNEATFQNKIQRQFKSYFLVPEGGSNLLGVRGCTEILKEIEPAFDIFATPVGSATTLSGLILSASSKAKVWGFLPLKGGEYLTPTVNNFVADAQNQQWGVRTFPRAEWHWQTDFHFGGFGKVNRELIDFMNQFFRETEIPLDPIYTGKMMFGLAKMAEQNKLPNGKCILALHTGGLQGIKGMNQRLKNKGYSIEYEKMVVADVADSRDGNGANQTRNLH